MVWLKIEHKNIKFGSGTLQCITSHKHCVCIYHGVLLSPHLKNLNKTLSLQIYDWKHTGAKLAICTALIEGRQAGARAETLPSPLLPR